MSVDPHLAPHWPTSALITIDVQRDFLSEGPFGIPGTTEVLPLLRDLTAAFRAAGRPIVHIVRLYPADGGDVDRVRRTLIENGAEFARPGSPGRLLAPGLAPAHAPDLDDDVLLKGEPQPLGPAEFAVYKPRWGAFYRTPLAGLLDGLGVDTVVFAGCNLPNCPRASIIEAHERDLRVVLATDAISQASAQGFREIAGIGTVLMSTPDISTAVRERQSDAMTSGRVSPAPER
ncbi:cysteine hydrolase family protein [Jidongwangia harbinensis]|uniref:cysteine hydrolase family protein n=1 Tax=Jidongwangia harbinensis TaxID=2878561 RepID=UPI001CDA48D1|nr:isochorismatase family cysteine hydrolase [Jidongwangia harbinensis]MCA2213096.1 cysteine hydrolase [Jidongwangia harbinensis]